MIRVSPQVSDGSSLQSDELVYLAFRDDAIRIVPMTQLWKERVALSKQDLDAVAVFHQSQPISEIRPLVEDFEAKGMLRSAEVELLGRAAQLEGETHWQEKPAVDVSGFLEDLKAFARSSGSRLALAQDEVLLVRGDLVVKWFEAELDPEPGSLAEWLQDADGRGALARRGSVQRLAEERVRIIETVPMLDAAGLAQLRGSLAKEHRALAQRLRDSGELLGVKIGREFRYPEFQFDATSGQIRPQMAEILARVRSGEEDPDGWRAMHWFFARAGTLAGDRPWEVFPSDPDRVLEGARAEFFDVDPVPEAARR